MDYLEYNQEEAKKILSEEYGWEDYGGKHEENYYTQWFQNCYLPIKFNIDKRRAHYSSLINSGQMTREEAVRKLLEPVKFRPLIKPEEFMAIPKRSHSDYPSDKKKYDFLCKVVKNVRKVGRIASKGLGD